MLQTYGGELMRKDEWHRRSPARLPDPVWSATLDRVRSEFEEMPCLRVTLEQARLLFGLPGQTSSWILLRLAKDGFLVRTDAGEFVRRQATP
jgi:hypothetical protein